jgi:hypothetical protein
MVASHGVIGQVADGNAAGRTAGRSALPPLQSALEEPMPIVGRIRPYKIRSASSMYCL